jgi:hypothetical protein
MIASISRPVIISQPIVYYTTEKVLKDFTDFSPLRSHPERNFVVKSKVCLFTMKVRRVRQASLFTTKFLSG